MEPAELTPSQARVVRAMCTAVPMGAEHWHSAITWPLGTLNALRRRGLVEFLEKKGIGTTHRLVRLTEAGKRCLNG